MEITAAAASASSSPEEPSSAPASPTNASTPLLPDKRPSPWRGKTTPLTGTGLVRESSANKKKPKAAKPVVHRHRRLLQDAVSIRIPLGVTADLGVALRRSREKRAEGLYKAFPALKPVAPVEESKEEEKDDGAKGEATTEKDDDVQAKRKKQAKKPTNVPQPHEYGSIVDYLEAKYVQGVMVDHEDDEQDDREGHGSVYSQDSFFDDTDLQRTVAEQVLAHTTTTKLELEDDDAFFVNVGNLEVEETDLTQGGYDPLDDNEKTSPKRKRKKSSETVNGTKKTKTNGSVTNKASTLSPGKKSKIPPKDENVKPDKKELSSLASNASPAELEKLKQASAKRERKMKKIYDSLAEMVKSATSDELPRRKTKDRVSVTCPEGKQHGDTILFANPHVPGQKLKVKIPKKCGPGETFKVTVPVADTGGDDDTDYNKFSREFYDSLDDYARAYDDWIDNEQDVHKASGDKEYVGHFEKRKKFDTLLENFPKDLKTLVDKAYLQKILRRARQNKHKREKTMKKQAVQDTGQSGGSDDESKEEEKEAAKPKTESIAKSSPATKSKLVTASTDMITVNIPQLSTSFTEKVFDRDDWEVH